MIGIVKKAFSSFGFLTADGKQDYFFHVSEIKEPPPRSNEEEENRRSNPFHAFDIVSFDLERDKKEKTKMRAINLKWLGPKEHQISITIKKKEER